MGEAGEGPGGCSGDADAGVGLTCCDAVRCSDCTADIGAVCAIWLCGVPMGLPWALACPDATAAAFTVGLCADILPWGLCAAVPWCTREPVWDS